MPSASITPPSAFSQRLQQAPFILSCSVAILVLAIFVLTVSGAAKTLRFDDATFHWTVMLTVGISIFGCIFFTAQAAYSKQYEVMREDHEFGFCIMLGGKIILLAGFTIVTAMSRRRHEPYSSAALFYSRMAVEVIVVIEIAALIFLSGIRSFLSKRGMVDQSPGGAELGERSVVASPDSAHERRRSMREQRRSRRTAAIAARESIVRIHNNLNSPVGSTRGR